MHSMEPTVIQLIADDKESCPSEHLLGVLEKIEIPFIILVQEHATL